MSEGADNSQPRDFDPSRKSSWETYPYNQEEYLPFREPRTEFGHETILTERFSGNESAFRVIDVLPDGSVETCDYDSKSRDLSSILLQKKAILVRFFCFSRRYDCPNRSWILSAVDLKKIFSRYHVQPSFVQRLKSFKFSAGPEVTRSYTTEKENETPLLKSHDLQMNINIPHSNSTVFCPCYITSNALSIGQVVLLFNDSPDERPGSKFIEDLERFLTTAASYNLYRQSLRLNRFTLPVLICGMVAEGWTQCTRELRAIQSDMERMVQDTPDHNSWDLQKLFGHLSFRLPAMGAFKETLELLKERNLLYTSEQVEHGGRMLIDDLVNHQLALIWSVRRDFDYMRHRLEDLSTLSFNLIARQDSKATATIAKQTFKDAMSMRTIAALTLFFLPGTFIASFFSMAFFSNDSDPTFLSKSSSWWIYFAVTIPLTLSTILIWAFWKHREETSLDTRHRVSHARTLEVPEPRPVPEDSQATSRKRGLFSNRNLFASFGKGTHSDVEAKAGSDTITPLSMENQTPSWFTRSKAFAWKEDLELHWGERARRKNSPSKR